MLFVRELHEVVGAREEAFESTFREGLAPALARGGAARLCYYLHQAHGAGPSYQVVTITALRDAAAWGELAHRMQEGDLAPLARELDAARHDVSAKALLPLPWSPLQQVELGGVPAAGDHEPALFMEDTVWPFEGRLEDYVMRAGSHYRGELEQRASERRGLIELLAGFRCAWGSGRRREIVLWQRVTDASGLQRLLGAEIPARYKRPGTWMHDALELRDRWESRLLRSARWSPLG
jgi:hypothetical protein